MRTSLGDNDEIVTMFYVLWQCCRLGRGWDRVNQRITHRRYDSFGRRSSHTELVVTVGSADAADDTRSVVWPAAAETHYR